jgi:hypothetical protein
MDVHELISHTRKGFSRVLQYRHIIDPPPCWSLFNVPQLELKPT